MENPLQSTQPSWISKYSVDFSKSPSIFPFPCLGWGGVGVEGHDSNDLFLFLLNDSLQAVATDLRIREAQNPVTRPKWLRTQLFPFGPQTPPKAERTQRVTRAPYPRSTAGVRVTCTKGSLCLWGDVVLLWNSGLHVGLEAEFCKCGRALSCHKVNFQEKGFNLRAAPCYSWRHRPHHELKIPSTGITAMISHLWGRHWNQIRHLWDSLIVRHLCLSRAPYNSPLWIFVKWDRNCPLKINLH